MFCVLPFGLSTACYIFTKLLRPLVKRRRSKGLRYIVYIDDGICASKLQDKCVENTKSIVDDLTFAGFILNIPKSKLTPSKLVSGLVSSLTFVLGDFLCPRIKSQS